MIPPVWPDAKRHLPEVAFPSYAYVPGKTPHPVRDPEGHMRGGEPVGGFLRGIDLYHAGYLWEAHEAWEGLWKATTDPTSTAPRISIRNNLFFTVPLLHRQRAFGGRSS